MSKHRICWECKEALTTAMGRVYPSDHCHHDDVPEEKPKKCWCEKFTNLKVYSGSIGTTDYTVIGFAEHCPKCGKKI